MDGLGLARPEGGQERSPHAPEHPARLTSLWQGARPAAGLGVGTRRAPWPGGKGENGSPPGILSPGPRPLPARRARSSARDRANEGGARPRAAARGRAQRPTGPRPPAPGPGTPGTFDHVAVDGGAELLARALVEVLPVDDAHLLEEGGLAALARAQQQDLHEPLHVGLLPRQAFVDLLGLALLLGLAARQHAAREAHGQHGPRRQEVRHLAAAAASAGPSGSSASSAGGGRLRLGGSRARSAAAARARWGREGARGLTRRAGRAGRARLAGEGGKEGGPGRGGGPGACARPQPPGGARARRGRSPDSRPGPETHVLSRARDRRRARAGRCRLGGVLWSRDLHRGRAPPPGAGTWGAGLSVALELAAPT